MLSSMSLLPLLLSLICILLIHISPTPVSGGNVIFGELFENPMTDINVTTHCLVCVGDSHPAKSKTTEGKSCSQLRKIIRTMNKDLKDPKKTKKQKKKDIKKEAEKRVFEMFGQICPIGETDCFMSFAVDKRIIGFESMGCGDGPPELPAEPNEPCETGYIRLGGKNQEMETCVCANKHISSKDKKKKKEMEKKVPYAFCNYKIALNQRGSTSIGSPKLLTILAASGIILRTILMLT